jgi:ubiquinol-cytochrome c reductase iron-sulfur subunit
MSENGVAPDRRRFLTTTATVVGGAGVIAAAVPFISAMTPSAKTKAIGAPVEVDVSDMQPGDRKIVKWQGKPVWILRRGEESVDELYEHDDRLRDPASEVTSQQPAYAQNEYRSIKPEYLVVIGLCTHLGCSPTYVPRGEGESHNLSSAWPGGFFCPCHGSRFDLAGRVFKDVPAPTNLVVPPYQYLDEHRLLIGDDSGATA